jgi:hypothetical protein
MGKLLMGDKLSFVNAPMGEVWRGCPPPISRKFSKKKQENKFKHQWFFIQNMSNKES